jgi:hypothetical protein
MQEATSKLPHTGGQRELVRPASKPKRAALLFEIAVAGFAVLGVVAAELMLAREIHGTNFAGGDGKMAQAVILAAYKFGGLFQFNTIDPLQGLGSQLLPINVWINPTYWPFAIFDKSQAADLAAAIALGVFAFACYAMARCFDLPIVPSAIAAQFGIVLFAPILFLLQLSTVFSLMIGNAVVYAPYMVALGLLARLEPGSWRRFGLITAGMFALLFYSLCCDPLWSVVSGSAWAVPFAIVALSPMRPTGVLVRWAALGCCLLLLGIIGAAEYLLTLVRYTMRVQFVAVVDPLHLPQFASALFFSPYMKYFYLIWALGWLLGLLTLRGRARVLVLAGIITCGVLLAEILLFLLLQNGSWLLPRPMYVEQSLFPLFLVSAATGYWGALRAAAVALRPSDVPRARSWSFWHKAKPAAAFAVVALVPAAVVYYAVSRPLYIADLYNEPWPKEAEFEQFLVNETSQAVGQPFRGAVLFDFHDYPRQLTVDNLWLRSVPTISQYGQLVTPQSTYFNAAVLKNDIRLMGPNGFMPFVNPSPEVFSKVLPMLGTRYFVVGNHIDRFNLVSLAHQVGQSLANQSARPVITLPQGSHHKVGPTSVWHVYELSAPNVGNYSPTEVLVAETGAQAAAMMIQPSFDFTRQVVLSAAIDESLVPARNMQMSWIRGGLHVSGQSDGTSLVVLPQQFSHCLRARDESIRLVRVNLMLTGMIFSGQADTDIVSDYGIFTPRCRWADLADINNLKLKIDAHAAPSTGNGLVLNWGASMAKLRAAVGAIR